MSPLGFLGLLVHGSTAVLNAAGILAPVTVLAVFAFISWCWAQSPFTCCGRGNALQTRQELQNVLINRRILAPGKYRGIVRVLVPPGELFARLGACGACVCFRCRLSLCWKLITWVDAVVGAPRESRTPSFHGKRPPPAL